MINVGDSVISTDTVYCSIPYDTQSPPVHSVIEVNTSPIDTELAGTVWSVVDVDAGGMFQPTRRLQITKWAENKFWEG
jgi:hypothetical protein